MRKKTTTVLGLFVTDTSVEGVLLSEEQDGKINLLHRVSKPRSRRGESVLNSATVLPGMKNRSESDYTMEVGDGSSQSSELFMKGEFGASGTAVATSDKVRTNVSARKETTPFGSQLREITAECREAGHPAPTLAFCIGSSEITYHETVLQSTEEESKQGRINRRDRKALVAKLGESIHGDFDHKRAVFLPMAHRGKHRRFLAIVPSSSDPVSQALDILSTSSKQKVFKTDVVDSELSLLLSLVQHRPEPTTGITAIIRVNATETTVLFLKDGELDKYEQLRSLTSYDSIDTVCSRVVLKQDELRIGQIDEIFVSTEHQAAGAVEGFASFFPESKVYGLAETLTSHNITGINLSDLRANSIPAAAVALRSLKGWDSSADADTVVNLLDKKRRSLSSTRKGAYAWHTMVVLLMIFGSTIYYTWTYMTNQDVIDIRNEEIRLNPPEFPTENPVVLAARVDSLQRVYQNHNRALLVLDSLLTGSDKWSSTLDQLSQSTQSIQRIWFKAMTPQGGSIRLEGNALARNRIASMAQQWNGSIEKLNFAEIQGMRVYSFIMSVPIETKLPEVVIYLRKNSLDELEPEESEALIRMADSGVRKNTNQ